MRIGLISDTHGLLRPQALQALRGCDHILHAGDIGGADILPALAEIAPVTAVRGNNDTAPWAAGLPEVQQLLLASVPFFLLHDLKELQARRPGPDVQVVVCGHSHKPQAVRNASGVLVVNPGSAGPRRFKLPVTVARLLVAPDGVLTPEIVELL